MVAVAGGFFSPRMNTDESQGGEYGGGDWHGGECWEFLLLWGVVLEGVLPPHPRPLSPDGGEGRILCFCRAAKRAGTPRPRNGRGAGGEG